MSWTEGIKADLSDEAPTGAEVTEYDRLNAPVYLRLIDADHLGAEWHEVAFSVLGIVPIAEPDRARRVHEIHLARARWMVEEGYRGLLRLPGAL